MKLCLALALVSPIVVCGDIKYKSEDISPEHHSRAKRALRAPPIGEDDSHHGKTEGLPVEQPDRPTVPVPPVPGTYHGTLPREVLRHYEERGERGHDALLSSTPSPPRLRHSPVGAFSNLVLLLRFADHASRELPSREDVSRLYNSEEFPLDDRRELVREPRGVGDDVAPTGSVRQVYLENSHSAFRVETTVVGWIDLPETEAYYADGRHGLSASRFDEAMVEALDVLDADPERRPEHADFDFGAFDLDENGALDGFGVLHSGYGAEFGGTDCEGAEESDRIWSHKGGFDWTSRDGGASADRYYVSSALRGKCKSRIVRMGVLCHELGHYLGLPDLYDATFEGRGLGAYDFMSLSWGWDGTGLYPGNLSAWSKLRLGWAAADLIVADGTYELEAATTAGIKIYKITHNFPEGEYLLLENRQPIAYDSKMVQGGIAIYHVDETARGQRDRGFPSQPGFPENGNHYRVALLAAGGDYHLERGADEGGETDLWHAGSVLKELGPGPDIFPNTDYYEKAKGEVGPTGIRIFGFSESGINMTFSVDGFSTAAGATTRPASRAPAAATADRGNATTRPPSRAPTKSPTTRRGKAERRKSTSAPTTTQEEEDPVHVPTIQSVVSLARN